MALKYKTFQSPFAIDLQKTLNSGQCFSFKSTNYGFVGPINNKLYVLRNNKEITNSTNKENTTDKHVIEYLCLNETTSKEESEKDIFDFFNLQLNYTEIPNYIKGLCILKIDPVECIFSFICSTNNQIKRITKMVSYLFSLGRPIFFQNMTFYNFPDLEKLIGIENQLVVNKFGYRAKSIVETAKALIKINLENLKAMKYSEIFKSLIKLRGIGPKVADCICLYSFNHLNVVPVDVHIFRQSVRLFELKETKLTQKLMNEIQKLWYKKFGEVSGVVQLYIFYNSVNKIQEEVLNKIQEEVIKEK